MKIYLLLIASLYVLQIKNVEATRRLSTIRVGAVNKERGREPFKEMPISTRDRGIDQFQKVEPEEGFYNTIDIYCFRHDTRFCLLFDKKGDVVGVQISYLKRDVDEVDPNLYNYSNPNYLQTNFFNTPAYTVRIYFSNPDKLTERGRNSTSLDIIDGLWSKVDGKLVRFDYRCQPNSPILGKHFFMQGCVDMLGQVYSRGFHEHAECKNAFWLFLVFDEEGSLIGFGHAAPSIVSSGRQEDVFNHPIREKISERLLPDAPKCYYDLAKYDYSTVVIFLINDPWDIRCSKCLCEDRKY